MIDIVPVIDITRLDSAPFLEAIDRACRHWGFFQVVGHGIDATLTERLLAVAREFFAQPSAVRGSLVRDAANSWGWSYFGRELTRNRPDWKKIHDLGPASDEAGPTAWLRAPARERGRPAAGTLRADPVARIPRAACRRYYADPGEEARIAHYRKHEET